MRTTIALHKSASTCDFKLHLLNLKIGNFSKNFTSANDVKFGVYNGKNWKKAWKLKDRGCVLVFLLKIPKEFFSFPLPPPSYSWWVKHRLDAFYWKIKVYQKKEWKWLVTKSLRWWNSPPYSFGLVLLRVVDSMILEQMSLTQVLCCHTPHTRHCFQSLDSHPTTTNQLGSPHSQGQSWWRQ